MRKKILITGATGGIGREVARLLAQNGCSLYLHYYKNESIVNTLLEELADYGGEYIPIQADLSLTNGYKRLVENVFSVDGMVYCSGTSTYGLFSDASDKEMAELWSIHVHSLMCLTRELLPQMLRRQTGNIVVISSIWGQVGAAMEVIYSSVKGAQLSFVKALSKEMALNGIRVNAIAPGAVNTAMLHTFSLEERGEIEADIPMGRLGRPEEIAEAVHFLLSERSSYMTGQVLSVNGGWYM